MSTYMMSFYTTTYKLFLFFVKLNKMSKKVVSVLEKFNPQKYADDELERVTLRISHKTKEELATIAQKENISLNTLIIRCINFALEHK